MERGARPRMPMLARAVAAGVVVVSGAMSVVACAPSSPQPTPTPTAIFASEEEALAAATDTYAKYSAALDGVYAAGGVDTAALEPLVTEEYWSAIRDDRTLVDRGWRTVGTSSFDSFAVVDSHLAAPPFDLVATLCKDVTSVRIVDGSGIDVTPSTRRDRYPLTVTFRSHPEDETSWLVAESDPGMGEDSC